MRFKHLGAKLLAGALAFAMVMSPAVQVSAHTAEKDGRTGAYRNGVGGLIDTNENVIYKFTKKQIQEMKAQNTQEYRDIVDKYGDPEDWDTDYIDGIKYYIMTETTYTNTLNGQTSDDKNDVGIDSGMPKTIVLNAGSYYELDLYFNAGNVGITGLKSSKSKVASAVIAYQNKETTSDTVDIYKDSKKNKSFYYGAYRERIYVSDPNAAINASSGTVTLRVNAKKKGSAKLSFNIVDRKGAKTASKSITIKVKDTQPFKVLTYANKNLLSNPVIGKEDKNYIYYGNNTDKDASLSSGYTTKSQGKLTVKMNSGYKLVKIQVGKLYKEKIGSNLDESDNKSNYAAGKRVWNTYKDKKQFDSYSGETTSGHKVDLNGDGDYLDTINGVTESNVDYKYTQVRNNTKIKLSKVTRSFKYNRKTYNGSAYTSQVETDENGAVKKDDNDEEIRTYNLVDKEDYTEESGSNSSMYAPTSILITYYDKEAGEYKVCDLTVYLRVSKK